jgi:hypothetical protein
VPHGIVTPITHAPSTLTVHTIPTPSIFDPVHACVKGNCYGAHRSLDAVDNQIQDIAARPLTPFVSTSQSAVSAKDFADSQPFISYRGLAETKPGMEARTATDKVLQMTDI